ncbi:MAG: hypothetical protein SF339_29300 [Blastocatellia bacterium]|nr:hypothetical protein [Blastocatellia bacterium]
MQFHVLVMASLLWAFLHQSPLANSETPEAAQIGDEPTTTEPAKTITASLSQLFRVRWRWMRQHLRIACHCLAQPVSVFFKELAALRL